MYNNVPRGTKKGRKIYVPLYFLMSNKPIFAHTIINFKRY
jgi:hypothetical protein